MRIVVVGAGVIGSVFAARLRDAGNDVVMVARGRRLATLTADGLRVRHGRHVLRPEVELSSAPRTLPEAALIVVAVRANQLDSVLGLLETSPGATVLFLQHLGAAASNVLDRVGAERTVLAFPGVGGLIHEDGVVEYVEIGAQSTTFDTFAQRGSVVERIIASTGLRTTLERDIGGWYATHEVFVACMGAGILSCGGNAEALAQNAAQLRTVVSAVREGFAALDTQGVRVTPNAIRVLFSGAPRWFAAAYWRHALRGPIGTMALAPHFRASRNDELPLLCANVVDRMGKSATPALRALLSPYTAC
ncbi:ketopantoate reductase family protein [Humibacter antri]